MCMIIIILILYMETSWFCQKICSSALAPITYIELTTLAHEKRKTIFSFDSDFLLVEYNAKWLLSSESFSSSEDQTYSYCQVLISDKEDNLLDHKSKHRGVSDSLPERKCP